MLKCQNSTLPRVCAVARIHWKSWINTQFEKKIVYASTAYGQRCVSNVSIEWPAVLSTSCSTCRLTSESVILKVMTGRQGLYSRQLLPLLTQCASATAAAYQWWSALFSYCCWGLCRIFPFNLSSVSTWLPLDKDGKRTRPPAVS